MQKKRLTLAVICDCLLGAKRNQHHAYFRVVKKCDVIIVVVITGNGFKRLIVEPHTNIKVKR